MNKLILVLLAISVAVFAVSVEESFSSWTLLHGKNYKNPGERFHRFAIYKDNLAYIENHNRKQVGFTVGMNQFGDLTAKEFASIYNGMRVNATGRISSADAYKHNPLFEMAATVDWRTKGAVTGVKNQGQCGSCWAFSTTGSTEGAHKLKTNMLVSLSEQNLVDCSTAQGNQGCDGGLMDQAFQYIISNNGIDTESSYPYTAQDGTCSYSTSNIGATLTSYKDVASGSEAALTSAIQTIGPISVAIDASHSSFQFYTSGVYYEPNCSPSQLDHGVLAVGYGDQSGKDYYIVKNSWGTSWGMSGYILMSRNKNNNCGIATMSSYPIV